MPPQTKLWLGELLPKDGLRFFGNK